jgi:chromosome segregation ATPase
MWGETKRQRFQDLRRRELDGSLDDAERTELAGLIQELEDWEAATLAPAIERLQSKNLDLREEAARLDAQKEQLTDLLRRKTEYLARARAMVKELERERLDLLERFEQIAGESLELAEPASTPSS